MHPFMEPLELLSLVWRKVLEFRHPVQHLLLLFRGQIIETAQMLPQVRLAVGRQLLKLRIIPQQSLLVLGRKVLVLPQPIASSSSGCAIAVGLI